MVRLVFRSTQDAELQSVRAFGLRNPVCVIPNGMNLPAEPDGNANAPPPQSKTVLLYLGRLHPKKGLVNLLKATAQLSQSEEMGRRMASCHCRLGSIGPRERAQESQR